MIIKSVRAWALTLPREFPMLGVGVPKGLLNFQSMISGVKTHFLEEFFISLESY
jgi:hypothetical protein